MYLQIIITKRNYSLLSRIQIQSARSAMQRLKVPCSGPVVMSRVANAFNFIWFITVNVSIVKPRLNLLKQRPQSRCPQRPLHPSSRDPTETKIFHSRNHDEIWNLSPNYLLPINTTHQYQQWIVRFSNTSQHEVYEEWVNASLIEWRNSIG